MDKAKIADVLRATMNPVRSREAEKYLDQLKTIPRAVPTIVEIVVSNEIDLLIRQAGAIYIKNLIFRHWPDLDEGEIPRFVMGEEDKSMLRDLFVEAAVFCPPTIRKQVCLCVKHICGIDFPDRWPFLVQNICVCIDNPDAKFWTGALYLVLALVQALDYDDKTTGLDQVTNLVLPKVQERMVGYLMHDGSQQSLSIQHLALKLFCALTQRYMTVLVLTKDDFTTWMQIILGVLDRKNPEYEMLPENEDDEEKLVMTEWWKTKKWAMRILFIIFEDHVSPPRSTEVTEFSTWYLDTFSLGALHVIFNMLTAYRKKEFVADKVLTDGLFYLQDAVSYADMWKFMKPLATAMISDVLYPLLCFSKADARLWREDPIEFIQVKYDDLRDDVFDMAFAAEQLLYSMCKKRKGIRQHCLAFITQVLNSTNSTPEQIDGGLRMFGSITDILLTKNEYKDQFENVIVGFVFPSFASKFPYLRSRVAWLLSKLKTLNFTREDILQETIRILLTAIQNKQEELPVKVQAAMVIHDFIQHQPRALKFIQPQVRPLCVELLEILCATDFDDLTTVLSRIICAFVNEVAPVAKDICNHLARKFFEIMETDNENSNQMLMSMGLLSTMKTLGCIMNDIPQISRSLEPILVQVVRLIFEESLRDFYADGFALITMLTESRISPTMWKFFEMICAVIEGVGIDYFKSMTPALYNYITIDTEALLSTRLRLLSICRIMKAVFAQDNDSLSGEDAQSHAAKLMEVLILKFGHRVQNIIPNLIQLVVNRLARHSTYTELKTTCLQVILASMHNDPALTISALPSLDIFIQQWIMNTNYFIGYHERRVCVLGFCSLLQFLTNKGHQNRPLALEQYKRTILPLLLSQLEALKRIYAGRVTAKKRVSFRRNRKAVDRVCDSDVLDSDEDEIAGELDLSGCSTGSCGHLGTGTNADEDFDEQDITPLSTFTTTLDEPDCPVDEYIVFKQVLLNVQNCDPVWYAALTDVLNEQQRRSMAEIFALADARKEAALSKQIEKSGGFGFSQPQPVPAVFNFGTPPSSK